MTAGSLRAEGLLERELVQRTGNTLTVIVQRSRDRQNYKNFPKKRFQSFVQIELA